MQNQQSKEKNALWVLIKTVEKKSEEITNTLPSQNLSTKGGHLCVNRVSKPDIEGVIVLDEGGMLVMKN